MAALDWERLDIVLVTGDTYIDSPLMGVALIGKLLIREGYRVGIVAQPSLESDQDIKRLGEPLLFWGITSGAVDSMVANYTSVKKWRKQDDYTPGGINDRRPDRALIRYANLIRRYFKNTAPLVLGGIEASLRRFAHYDFWSNRVRKSILIDAKADILVYGMGEKAVIQLAHTIGQKKPINDIHGICFVSSQERRDYRQLPGADMVQADTHKFIEAFEIFYKNNDPLTAKGLFQRQDTRFVIQNPPQPYLTQAELDQVYTLSFERKAHPFYARQGFVRALDTIQFSVPVHRGCYGECHFCAISVHEGRTVRYRSADSILNEIKGFKDHEDFKGILPDLSGPTANMYGFECRKKRQTGACVHQRCLFPRICPQLKVNHTPLVDLLRRIDRLPFIKKVFIASGIRYDLLLSDKQNGMRFLRAILPKHISGQMKIAPEHSAPQVLAAMGKPSADHLLTFMEHFHRINRQARKPCYLTFYLMAAHPGCRIEEMRNLKTFVRKHLKIIPEQVQVFTPTPSTYSTLMYYTGVNPFTGNKIHVERNLKTALQQKKMLQARSGAHKVKR